jgi:hypothetical protein
MTIRYIHQLIEKYSDEYKGDEYNLIHSSVPMNINYIHRYRIIFVGYVKLTNIITYISQFHVTDECIGELTWQYAVATWLLYSSVNR